MSAMSFDGQAGAQLGGGPAQLPATGSAQFDPIRSDQTDQKIVNTAIDAGSVTAPLPSGGKGGFAAGPQLGGGPAETDFSPTNSLAPAAETPMQPQQMAVGSGGKSSGGKGGFNPDGAQGISQQQLQAFARSILNQ